MARKEQIYTIPVNDAFNQFKLCPICELREKRTESLIEYYLGPSLMEPDNRVETNEKGFCNDHYSRLYNSQNNRLGLGLITHTYMLEQYKELQKILKDSHANEPSFFNLRKSNKDSLINASEKVLNIVNSCALCDKLNHTMKNYIDVIFYQFQTEKEFRDKFERIQMFCLPDMALLLKYAAEYLKQDERAAFVNMLENTNMRKYKDLANEVEWFTLKFDYRYKDKSWGNSKTSIPRAINTNTGLAPLEREGLDD